MVFLLKVTGNACFRYEGSRIMRALTTLAGLCCSCSLLGCVPAPRAFSERSAPVQIAITVDDLPLHGPLPPGETRFGLAQRMLSVLHQHQVAEAFGFVNGQKIERDATLIAVLDAWTQARQPLGNHGFRHLSLDDVTVETAFDDVLANERVLKQQGPLQRWYRFPFLREGDSLAKRRAMRSLLKTAGYRIAEVSIDADDWAFNQPFVRCALKGDAVQQEQLKTLLVTNHVEELRRMRQMTAGQVYREVPQVLLLHLGGAEVASLDALLTAFENEGAQWISLQTAMEDPYYQHDPDLAFGAGAAFPYLTAKAMGLTGGNPIYARGLEQRLDETCR
jgi:peptidoglycan-N-acetylglucosamine deacetylase